MLLNTGIATNAKLAVYIFPDDKIFPRHFPDFGQFTEFPDTC